MLSNKDIKILNSQLGISLIELILGITIMLIILIPISSSLRAGIQAYQYNLLQSQNTTAARQLLNTIADELRYVQNISIPTGTSVILPAGQITYYVEGKKRTISTTTGTPSTTNTLVVNYAGTVHKTIALNNLQSITISNNGKQLIISAKLNNKSYVNSPTMDLSTTIIMQNIVED